LIKIFFLVAAGGALGASLRFVCSQFFKNYIFPSNIFIATLFVNVVGSFLIGYIISLAQNNNYSDYLIKYFIIIGVLGSFTTFSTFSMEALEMLTNGKVLVAFIYIIISIILCLSFTYIGLNMSKMLS